MFGYRKYQGCPTALLSLTEQWKKDLDKHNWHDNRWLFLEKLKFYGIRDHALSLLRSYLSSRYQRVIKA